MNDTRWIDLHHIRLAHVTGDVRDCFSATLTPSGRPQGGLLQMRAPVGAHPVGDAFLR